MSFSIGTPVMMLDRNNHFGENSKKHGNARAVLCEAMSERQCKDEDLDKSLTKTNTYYMFDDYYCYLFADLISEPQIPEVYFHETSL